MLKPNPAFERTANGGAARCFNQGERRRCLPLNANVGHHQIGASHMKFQSQSYATLAAISYGIFCVFGIAVWHTLLFVALPKGATAWGTLQDLLLLRGTCGSYALVSWRRNADNWLSCSFSFAQAARWRHTVPQHGCHFCLIRGTRLGSLLIGHSLTSIRGRRLASLGLVQSLSPDTPVMPNPALERTVNGGAARWFLSTWAAPLSAAQLERWASPWQR